MIVSLLVLLGLLASGFGYTASEQKPAQTSSAAPASVIDVFCHVIPPKYMEALKAQIPKNIFLNIMLRSYPKLYDMDTRFKDTDVPGYKQVISTVGLPIESVADPQKAVDMAKLANNEMAELVKKYPDRFIAALGILPMNNMDAALKEADRCINELGFKGIMIYTPINDKPLDSPEFIPLYEKMAKYDLPIFIHPYRAPDYPDYRTETISKFHLFRAWGWEYESTIAISRLVYSGVLEKYPNLKFVAHHGGSMIPFLQRFSRVNQPGLFKMGNPNIYAKLSKPTITYFQKFYADTSNMYSSAIIEVSNQFYGADHMLFATDYPFPGSSPGKVISYIMGMNISNADKTKIFETNAKKLLKLP
jgi:predicted TIM-barrel fold metal-dependent hydrolase